MTKTYTKATATRRARLSEVADRQDAVFERAHGRRVPDRQEYGSTHLEAPQSVALEGRNLQGLYRSEPRREANRRGRPLPPPTRTGDRLQLRREHQGPDLNRTQPTLRLKPGRAGTTTRDYKRHGTTHLSAATNVATGEVLYGTWRSHKAPDVHAFFKLIGLYVPRHLQVHVLLDNLLPHKAEPIATWLTNRKRACCHLHFTPTSPSWLNLVAGRYSHLPEPRLTHSVLTPLDDLLTTNATCAEHWKPDPKSFVWKKPANNMVPMANPGRSTLASAKSPMHD